MPQCAAVFGLQFLQVLFDVCDNVTDVTEVIPRHVIFMGVSLEHVCIAPDTELHRTT